MKKTFLTTLMIISLCQVTFSQMQQGSLKVIIRNAEDAEIIGAQVALYQGELLVTGGVTDPFGLAIIPAIDPGKYRVEISSLGFEKEIRTIEIAGNNIRSISVNPEPRYSGYAFNCCGCPKRPKKKNKQGLERK